MSSEDIMLLESKLRWLGYRDLSGGLTCEELVVWKKLFKEYVQMKQEEWQDV